MARRGRECEDAWGGFDTAQTVYDPKEEKRYESLVWKYLAGVALVVCALVFYMHTKELHIINNGTCIVASYDVDSHGNEIVRYSDENEKLYMYNVSGLSAVHEETQICLYYLDNVQDAVSKTKWQLWAVYYLFFGILFGFSVWRIIKINKNVNKQVE